MPVIRIPGTGTVPLFINGIACGVPRGIDAMVSADQLSVLRNAGIAFASAEPDFDIQAILKHPISRIVAMLDDLSTERIVALVAAERAGRGRATLIATLGARLA